MDKHLQARALIRPVKESVEDELLARPGVVGVDIAEKVSGGKPTGELSIVVFVNAKKPASRVAKGDLIPAEINGVKTDVQELTVELQSPAMRRLDEITEMVDAATYSSLHGGIGIGPRRSVYMTPPDVPTPGNYVFVGTLATMVKDRATGSTMALTNFHVACVTGWAVGDRMVQPSLVDNSAAATEFGSIVRALISDQVDGALISVDAGKAWDPSIEGIGNVAGTATATVGLAVEKRGRTTEHTYGSVVSTDFTVSINYGGAVGTRTLHHQLRVQTDTTRSPRFSDHGDSGSAVVDGSRNVVGLLFAGSNDGMWTFANPIAAVQDDLGVDVIPYVKPPIVTRPNICTKVTTPVVCSVVTRYVSCFVTRPNICVKVTTPLVCTQVTRTASCILTRPNVCQVAVSRPSCPPIGPGDPGDPGPGFVDEAIADGAGEEFLAGYLAALEAVAAEESADSEGQA
jgi:hypothetical protein